jgi:hypothetical protein
MVRFPPGPLPQLMGWTEIFFGGLIVIRLGIFSLAVTGPAKHSEKKRTRSAGVDNNRRRPWKITGP